MYSLLKKHDRNFLFLLVIFSIIIAVIEMIGVTAIMPFISVASDFSLIHSNEYYKYFYTLLGFTSDFDYIVIFGIILLFFYIFRGVINLVYAYYLAKFSKGRYHLFSYRLIENYLGMSYKNFIEKNSSELTKTLINEAQNLTTMMSSILLVMSEVFVLIMIYSMMLYVDWVITLFISIFLIINVLFLVKFVSKRIKKEGGQRELFQKEFYEIINSTFGNFKIIKLFSNDEIVLKKFADTSHQFALSNIKTETLYHIPRLLIEIVAFLLVISMIIYLIFKNQGDISQSLSVISMFVLGLYRLMPSANRIMSGYNIIQYNYRALDIIHNDLMYEIENLKDDKISFINNITLKNISFEYIKNKPILEQVELNIKKGDKVAFIGESGSGKSTLVDIIIGLYKPITGRVYIDDVDLNNLNIKDWRKKVGYIPQNVYLFDGTVGENVAFGNSFDANKVKNVLKKAKILTFLENHQKGIDTNVGEGGIKLSGGQKQRIAIARALYSDPEILVLDEATSALDYEVEKEIMSEIYDIANNKTLIIIAHRLSTIERCNKIYKIVDKKLAIEKYE